VAGKTTKEGATRSAAPKRSFAERNGKLMTVEEVADELAVTTRMVLRLMDSGELRRTKVGVLRRVHRDDLADYIERQRGDA
jgi:excisionase family DNA binding protein